MLKKEKDKKTVGVTKGAPSGFMVSLMIHAAAFLIAGLLVVFEVVDREEKKFVPPKPVERPKMELKKPKVKLKKTAKPKPTTRIVTKVQKATMPDIQLPEMSGMGDGLAAGIGGFEMMPDLDQVSLFGGGQTIGNDFVGTFYDFKRDRTGRPIPMTPDEYLDELRRFILSGFRKSRLAQYYRSPKKLYATTFVIPPILSSVAPSAFDEPDTLGFAWMAHYEGQLVSPEDITFRFWGMGDDIMIVRVDGKIVLNACWPGDSEGIANSWNSSAPNNRRFQLGNNLSVGGDVITLKAGEPVDMEVMIGEHPGGVFSSMLTVQVIDEEYPRNRQSGPIYPIFKTAEPSRDLLQAIRRDMVEGEASLTNGPVFRDFKSAGVMISNQVDEAEETVESAPERGESNLRIWTADGGKTVEAEFISVIGDKAVLKTAAGRQIRVPTADLSEEDREYIQMENPPDFEVTFIKTSSQKLIETSPYNNRPPPDILEYEFGVRLRQTSARPYNYPVHVEYFAVASENTGDKYILVDKGEGSFTPTRENDRTYEFKGGKVEFVEYELTEQMRGSQYSDYLVLVRDKRGKIIQHEESQSWLWEHYDNLKQLPVGRYMDDTASPAWPTPPKAPY